LYGNKKNKGDDAMIVKKLCVTCDVEFYGEEQSKYCSQSCGVLWRKHKSTQNLLGLLKRSSPHDRGHIVECPEVVDVFSQIVKP
jgi:hypothetical protein